MAYLDDKIASRNTSVAIIMAWVSAAVAVLTLHDYVLLGCRNLLNMAPKTAYSIAYTLIPGVVLTALPIITCQIKVIISISREITKDIGESRVFLYTLFARIAGDPPITQALLKYALTNPLILTFIGELQTLAPTSAAVVGFRTPFLNLIYIFRSEWLFKKVINQAIKYGGFIVRVNGLCYFNSKMYKTRFGKSSSAEIERLYTKLIGIL